MSRIRSRGNAATELALARLLRANKITGWRRHVQVRIAEFGVRNKPAVRAAVNSLRTPHSVFLAFAVRPDFVFPKRKLAVFVDGCFWHGCPKHGTKPKGNATFWKKKFAQNIARDRRVDRILRSANWRVLRIWEHALRQTTMHRAAQRRASKKPQNQARLLNRLRRALH